MPRAIILLSGGIDSAVALWILKSNYDIFTLSFKYGDRNRKEMQAAKRLVKKANIQDHVTVDLDFLREVSELPELENSPILEKLRIPPTYIPSRNTIFFGIASYYAEMTGAKYIATGHSFTDPFPDSKPRYIKAVNKALLYGSWLGKKYKTRIMMPLAKLDKTGIIRLAIGEHVPLELTWSCYEDNDVACGRCNGCRDRLRAFQDIDKNDVIEYAHQEE